LRDDLIRMIFSTAKLDDSFNQIEQDLSSLSKDDISNLLFECGIIPEIFDHDSSEEKLWSKLTDIILAKSLSLTGVPSTVIKTRADSADVEGKTSSYSIVGDAKAFRLTRTAKNQKDFKVQSLDKWRKGKDYAVLVCPFFQYPTSKSQIYSQAINLNVTLLSYAHLKFILDNYTNQDLTNIWRVGSSIAVNPGIINLNSSTRYWDTLNAAIASIFNCDISEIKKVVDEEVVTVNKVALEEKDYLVSRKQTILGMTEQEAKNELIRKMKLDSKLLLINGLIAKYDE